MCGCVWNRVWAKVIVHPRLECGVSGGLLGGSTSVAHADDGALSFFWTHT